MIRENELYFNVLKGGDDKEEILNKYELSIKKVLDEIRYDEHTRDLFLTGKKLVYVLMEVTFNYEGQETKHEYECLAFAVDEGEVEKFALSSSLEERISTVALTPTYHDLLENMRDNGEKVESLETKIEYVITIPVIKSPWYEEKPECVFSSDGSDDEWF